MPCVRRLLDPVSWLVCVVTDVDTVPNPNRRLELLRTYCASCDYPPLCFELGVGITASIQLNLQVPEVEKIWIVRLDVAA